MSGQLSRPRRLERADALTEFSSGAADLDTWLIKFAWQNQRANTATTYVTCADTRVVGYYAVTVAAYDRAAAPTVLAERAPRQIPCILLARLAVDRGYQGSGLDAALLRDALERAVFVSDQIAAKAVLVHARDDRARDFYLANGDFLQSPVEPMHLFAPMKALAAVFGARPRQR